MDHKTWYAFDHSVFAPMIHKIKLGYNNVWVVAVASWYSCCLQYQRSVVLIQSSAKFIEHLFTFSCIEKTKIKKKEAENGPFF